MKTLKDYAGIADEFWTITVKKGKDGSTAELSCTGGKANQRQLKVLNTLSKKAVSFFKKISECNCKNCKPFNDGNTMCCLVFSVKGDSHYLVSGWFDLKELSSDSIGSIELEVYNPVLPEDN